MLREMARDIIGAQIGEIVQMRDWRKAWYGSPHGAEDLGDHGN